MVGIKHLPWGKFTPPHPNTAMVPGLGRFNGQNKGLASGPRGCMVATEGQSFFLSPGLLAGSSFAKRRVWQCGMCRRSELTTGGAGRGLPRRAGSVSHYRIHYLGVPVWLCKRMQDSLSYSSRTTKWNRTMNSRLPSFETNK